MADFAVKIDLNGLDKELRAFAKDVQRLPSSRANPLMGWAVDYRKRTAQARRPTVEQSGTFRGNRWPSLSPNTTGDLSKGRGRKKSSGGRYKAGDLILGKLRAQGMLGDWLQSDPIMGRNNLSLTISSNRPYTIYHITGTKNMPKRDFVWGDAIARKESGDLRKKVAAYLGKQLKRRIKK